MNAKFTPGPWSWFGNARNNEIYLATVHSGHRYVMGFKRWGMRGAQPLFQPANQGLVEAAALLTFEVGDREVRGVEQARANDSVYRLDINGIDCPDARLIAAAPDLLSALQQCVDVLADPIIGTTDHDDPDWYGRLDKALGEARTAILKATGEAK